MCVCVYNLLERGPLTQKNMILLATARMVINEEVDVFVFELLKQQRLWKPKSAMQQETIKTYKHGIMNNLARG